MNTTLRQIRWAAIWTAAWTWLIGLWIAVGFGLLTRERRKRKPQASASTLWDGDIDRARAL
jgi:hypothetical protein